MPSAVTTPIDTFMQIPGESMRMSAQSFRAAIDNLPGLRRKLPLSTEARVTSMAWWVACNRVHVIEQRLARWLLMCHDGPPARCATLHIHVGAAGRAECACPPRPVSTRAIK